MTEITQELQTNKYLLLEDELITLLSSWGQRSNHAAATFLTGRFLQFSFSVCSCIYGTIITAVNVAECRFYNMSTGATPAAKQTDALKMIHFYFSHIANGVRTSYCDFHHIYAASFSFGRGGGKLGVVVSCRTFAGGLEAHRRLQFSREIIQFEAS